MKRCLSVYIFLVLTLLFYFDSGFGQTESYNLDLSVANIRNTKGVIQVQVYQNQETFEKETPWKQYRFEKTGVKDRTLNFKITDIPGGVYGIAVLDDEDSDGKMKFRIFMPREGFGFFGYYPGKNKTPDFNDFKFYLKSDTAMTARIRYIL